MTKMKKVAFVMLLVLICSVSMVFAQSIKERKDIAKIIYTNDVHCGYKGDVGYAGLAAVIKDAKENYAYVTVVDNGDAIQGEAIGTVSNGEYLVQIMNKVGYDYCMFGNHEFDYGMDQLKKITKLNNAQYLAANITYTGADKANQLQYKPYDIVTYGDKKVAFIGLSTPESITKSTPKYFMENGKFVYEFASGKELYQVTQKYVNEVKSLGADYVIVCCHLGVEEASEPNRGTDLIANTYGIDVLIDGHSHTVANEEYYKNKNGKDVLYTQTGTKLENVGVLTIDLAEGTFSSELVVPTEKDDEVAAFVETIDAEYEAAVLKVVAKSEILLDINREDGTRAVRNRETAIGNLCADAYRLVSGADIGLSNGGGIRKTIKKGDITIQDIMNVFPYGNKLTVVEATGQQILDALEWGSQSTMANASADGKSLGESGGFLQVSGLKYTIDTSIPTSCVKDELGMFVEVAGARRVKDVMVGTEETGYKPIDPNATYSLACHNYKLKDMGDGYTMFVKDKILQDETMIDNQLLITYIVDYLGGTITAKDAKVEGRITVL